MTASPATTYLWSTGATTPSITVNTALNVTLAPAQMVVLPEAVIVAVGKAFTTTVVFAEVAVHPWLLDTTTDYAPAVLAVNV